MDELSLTKTVVFVCFVHRSVRRDLESQVVVVTENEELRKRLDNEKEVIFKTIVPANEATFKDPERFVPFWVACVATFIRGFF